MMLLERFHQVKMISNESVAQYIARVENLARQIKEAGETISDVAIVTKILGTLPAKYRNFRQAWLSMEEARQTLPNLKKRFLDEEASLTSFEEQESAFLASSSKKGVSKYCEKF